MSPTSSRISDLLCAALIAVATAGCASTVTVPLGAESVEIDGIPFFGQTGYWCGPNALATVLARAGVNVSPNVVAETTYLPGRRGSLQVEMAAAPREFGRLAVLLEPDIRALKAELERGYPVAVLQNLGVAWAPVWHYAVVVGYEPAPERFVLRSGDEPRRVMTRRAFEKAWRRADRWAIVVLAPGELPAADDATRYATAVAGLEHAGRHDAALIGYEAGLARWPGHRPLMLGVANTHYSASQFAEAVAGYRALLSRHPGYLPAVNNLAQTLLALDCADAADSIAASVDPTGGEFDAVLRRTRAQIALHSGGGCRLSAAGAATEVTAG